MSLRIRFRIFIKRVGLFPTVSKFESKSSPQLPFQSKIISTCSPPRHTLLQQNTSWSTWNQSPSSWEDNQFPHLGTPWHQWMVHWYIFIAPSMRGMLHTINPQHNSSKYSIIHFYSYPYFQYKCRELSPPINHRHYLYLGRPKSNCSLPFICRWYTKYSFKNCNTPQPHHPCNKTHQDNTHSCFLSSYTSIIINSTINSCWTPSCTSSKGGLRHCIISKGDSLITTINSKINTQASINKTVL